ncbi:MAG: phosphate acyltransferase, partial [Candidatus Omnitrophota bacterium]|nr:phosphate acyltransferase [Candidatus Omnitrophota bacterium]
LSSEEAFAYLTEFSLPQSIDKAKAAIASGNLEEYLIARAGIDAPKAASSLRDGKKRNYKSGFADIKTVILTELDGQARPLLDDSEALRALREAENDPVKILSVRVVELKWKEASGGWVGLGKDKRRIEDYYVVDFKGIRGKAPYDEMPFFRRGEEAVGREFPAVLVSCEWPGGLLPEPVFSVCRAESAVRKTAKEEIRQAYVGGSVLKVQITAIAQFSTDIYTGEHKYSGFRVSYRGVVDGFLHHKDTTPEIRGLFTFQDEQDRHVLNDLVGKEIEAMVKQCGDEGDDVRFTMIIQDRFSLHARTHGTMATGRSVEKLVEAQGKEQEVAVKITGLARFGDGQLSGFTVMYDGALDGFIHWRDTNEELRRLFSRCDPPSLEKWVGRDIDVRILSIDYDRSRCKPKFAMADKSAKNSFAGRASMTSLRGRREEPNYMAMTSQPGYTVNDISRKAAKPSKDSAAEKRKQDKREREQTIAREQAKQRERKAAEKKRLEEYKKRQQGGARRAFGWLRLRCIKAIYKKSGSAGLIYLFKEDLWIIYALTKYNLLRLFGRDLRAPPAGFRFLQIASDTVEHPAMEFMPQIYQTSIRIHESMHRIFGEDEIPPYIAETALQGISPQVYRCPGRPEIGRIAGGLMYEDAKEIIREKGHVVINFAAAPSVTDVYEVFFDLMEKNGLLGKIIGIHFDEMLGYKESADMPRAMRAYAESNCVLVDGFWMLRRGNGHTFEVYLLPYWDRIERAGGKVYYINALEGSVEEKKRKYQEIKNSCGGVDLACGGFGVNAHVGFNDPGTEGTNLELKDFMVLVAIDEVCRKQQYDDYKNLPDNDPRRYTSVDEVPTHALTITVAGIMSAKYRNYFIVPDAQKAGAVAAALEGPVDVAKCPASVVRLPQYAEKTRVFIDHASAAKLTQDAIHKHSFINWLRNNSLSQRIAALKGLLLRRPLRFLSAQRTTLKKSLISLAKQAVARFTRGSKPKPALPPPVLRVPAHASLNIMGRKVADTILDKKDAGEPAVIVFSGASTEVKSAVIKAVSSILEEYKTASLIADEQAGTGGLGGRRPDITLNTDFIDAEFLQTGKLAGLLREAMIEVFSLHCAERTLWKLLREEQKWKLWGGEYIAKARFLLRYVTIEEAAIISAKATLKGLCEQQGAVDRLTNIARGLRSYEKERGVGKILREATLCLERVDKYIYGAIAAGNKNSDRPEQNHIARNAQGKEEWTGLNASVEIKDTKVYVSGLPEEYQRPVQYYFDMVAGVYGVGFFVNLGRIELWRNLKDAGDFHLGTIRIDVSVFEARSTFLLWEALWHLLVTSLVSLIEDNSGVREAVATYLSIEHFWRPEEIPCGEKESYRENVLAQIAPGNRNGFALDERILSLYEIIEPKFSETSGSAWGRNLIFTGILKSISAQARYGREKRALDKFDGPSEAVNACESALARMRGLLVRVSLLYLVWQEIGSWKYVFDANERLSLGEDDPVILELMSVVRTFGGVACALEQCAIERALIGLIKSKEYRLIEQIKDNFEIEELEALELGEEVVLSKFDKLLEINHIDPRSKSLLAREEQLIGAALIQKRCPPDLGDACHIGKGEGADSGGAKERIVSSSPVEPSAPCPCFGKKSRPDRHYRETHYQDEPVSQYWWLALLKCNLRLIELTNQRKRAPAIEERDAAAAQLMAMAESLEKISAENQIAAVKYPGNIFPGRNLRQEAEAQIRTAIAKIRARNEPAANRALCAAMVRFGQELCGLMRRRYQTRPRARIRARFNGEILNPELSDDKHEVYGVYEVFRGHQKNLPVFGTEAVNFRVADYDRFGLFWDIFASVDEQFKGQIEEMHWLEGRIQAVQTALAELRSKDYAVSADDIAGLKAVVTPALEKLEQAIVFEKEVVQYALEMFLRQLEFSQQAESAGEKKMIAKGACDVLQVCLSYMERRLANVKDMAGRTKTGLLADIRDQIKWRNKEIIGRAGNILDDFKRGEIPDAYGRMSNFLESSRVKRYLREPEFMGVDKLFGAALGALRPKEKKGPLRTENAALAKGYIETARKRSEDAAKLGKYVAKCIDLYVEDNLGNKQGMGLERAFDKIYQEFLTEANLLRGPPPAELWFTKFYQPLFIHRRIKDPQKASKKIHNPTFYAVSEFILIQEKGKLGYSLKRIAGELSETSQTYTFLSQRQAIDFTSLDPEEIKQLAEALCGDFNQRPGGVDRKQFFRACLPIGSAVGLDGSAAAKPPLGEPPSTLSLQILGAFISSDDFRTKLNPPEQTIMRRRRDELQKLYGDLGLRPEQEIAWYDAEEDKIYCIDAVRKGASLPGRDDRINEEIVPAPLTRFIMRHEQLHREGRSKTDFQILAEQAKEENSSAVQSAAADGVSCYSFRRRYLSASTMISVLWKAAGLSSLSRRISVAWISVSNRWRNLSNMIPWCRDGRYKRMLPKSRSSLTRILFSLIARFRISKSGLPDNPASVAVTTECSNSRNRPTVGIPQDSSARNLSLRGLFGKINLFVLYELIGVFYAGFYIFFGDLRKVIGNNFIKGQAVFQQIKNLPDHYARAADNRFSVADFHIHFNTFKHIFLLLVVTFIILMYLIYTINVAVSQGQKSHTAVITSNSHRLRQRGAGMNVVIILLSALALTAAGFAVWLQQCGGWAEFWRSVPVHSPPQAYVWLIPVFVLSFILYLARQNALPKRGQFYYNLLSPIVLLKNGLKDAHHSGIALAVIFPWLGSKKAKMQIDRGPTNTDLSQYPLPVSEEAQKKSEDRYGETSVLTDVRVSGFALGYAECFRDDHYEIIKQRLKRLRQLLSSFPPQALAIWETELAFWGLVITTNLALTGGNVAAVNLGRRASQHYSESTVFIHPYFFELTEGEQIVILYHELISHIARHQGGSYDVWAIYDTLQFALGQGLFLNSIAGEPLTDLERLVGAIGFLRLKGNDIKAVVFDVDKTLFYKKEDITKKGENKEKEDEQITIALRLLSQVLPFMKVAIISGNNYVTQKERLVDPWKELLRKAGRLADITGLTLYTDGGATKTTFDSSGTECTSSSYSKPFIIPKKAIDRINCFVQNLMITEGVELYRQSLEDVCSPRKFSTDETKAILSQAYEKEQERCQREHNEKEERRKKEAVEKGVKYEAKPYTVKSFTWVDNNANWKVWAGEGSRAEAEAKSMPWIEKRGQAGTVQITMKPVLSNLPGDLKLGFALRNRIIAKLNAEHIFDPENIALRPAGSTSIDIGASKDKALQDFIVTEGIRPENVVYFGDEFVPAGNDIPVLKVRGVNIISVGGEQKVDDLRKMIAELKLEDKLEDVLRRIKVAGNRPDYIWHLLTSLAFLRGQSEGAWSRDSFDDEQLAVLLRSADTPAEDANFQQSSGNTKVYRPATSKYVDSYQHVIRTLRAEPDVKPDGCYKSPVLHIIPAYYSKGRSAFNWPDPVEEHTDEYVNDGVEISQEELDQDLYYDSRIPHLEGAEHANVIFTGDEYCSRDARGGVIKLAEEVAYGIERIFPTIKVERCKPIEEVISQFIGKIKPSLGDNNKASQFILPRSIFSVADAYTLIITNADISGASLMAGTLLYDYIFGRAWPHQRLVIVSSCRLYDLHWDIFLSRIEKIAMHELGHLFGLGSRRCRLSQGEHCTGSTGFGDAPGPMTCVMSEFLSVEKIDRMCSGYCFDCYDKLRDSFVDEGNIGKSSTESECLDCRGVAHSTPATLSLAIFDEFMHSEEFNNLTRPEQEIALQRYGALADLYQKRHLSSEQEIAWYDAEEDKIYCIDAVRKGASLPGRDDQINESIVPAPLVRFIMRHEQLHREYHRQNIERSDPEILAEQAKEELLLNLTHNGEIEIKADDGAVFIFRYSEQERFVRCRTLKEVIRFKIDVFDKDNPFQPIGYIHSHKDHIRDNFNDSAKLPLYVDSAYSGKYQQSLETTLMAIAMGVSKLNGERIFRVVNLATDQEAAYYIGLGFRVSERGTDIGCGPKVLSFDLESQGLPRVKIEAKKPVQASESMRALEVSRGVYLVRMPENSKYRPGELLLFAACDTGIDEKTSKKDADALAEKVKTLIISAADYYQQKCGQKSLVGVLSYCTTKAGTAAAGHPHVIFLEKAVQLAREERPNIIIAGSDGCAQFDAFTSEKTYKGKTGAVSLPQGFPPDVLIFPHLAALHNALAQVSFLEKHVEEKQDDALSFPYLEEKEQVAKFHQARILLPEGTDPVVLEAAERFIKRGIGKVIFVGKQAQIEAAAKEQKRDIQGAEFADPAGYPEKIERYARILCRRKGWDEANSKDLGAAKRVILRLEKEKVPLELSYAINMVADGEADCLVAGKVYDSDAVYLAVKTLVGTSAGVKELSGGFLMCSPYKGIGSNGKFIVSDISSVICPKNAQVLADIAINTARDAAFYVDPKVRLAFVLSVGLESGKVRVSQDAVHNRSCTNNLRNNSLSQRIAVLNGLSLKRAKGFLSAQRKTLKKSLISLAKRILAGFTVNPEPKPALPPSFPIVPIQAPLSVVARKIADTVLEKKDAKKPAVIFVFGPCGALKSTVVDTAAGILEKQGVSWFIADESSNEGAAMNGQLTNGSKVHCPLPRPFTIAELVSRHSDKDVIFVESVTNAPADAQNIDLLIRVDGSESMRRRRIENSSGSYELAGQRAAITAVQSIPGRKLDSRLDTDFMDVEFLQAGNLAKILQEAMEEIFSLHCTERTLWKLLCGKEGSRLWGEEYIAKARALLGGIPAETVKIGAEIKKGKRALRTIRALELLLSEEEFNNIYVQYQGDFAAGRRLWHMRAGALEGYGQLAKVYAAGRIGPTDLIGALVESKSDQGGDTTMYILPETSPDAVELKAYLDALPPVWQRLREHAAKHMKATDAAMCQVKAAFRSQKTQLIQDAVRMWEDLCKPQGAVDRLTNIGRGLGPYKNEAGVGQTLGEIAKYLARVEEYKQYIKRAAAAKKSRAPSRDHSADGSLKTREDVEAVLVGKRLELISEQKRWRLPLLRKVKFVRSLLENGYRFRQDIKIYITDDLECGACVRIDEKTGRAIAIIFDRRVLLGNLDDTFRLPLEGVSRSNQWIIIHELIAAEGGLYHDDVKRLQESIRLGRPDRGLLAQLGKDNGKVLDPSAGLPESGRKLCDNGAGAAAPPSQIVEQVVDISSCKMDELGLALVEVMQNSRDKKALLICVPRTAKELQFALYAGFACLIPAADIAEAVLKGATAKTILVHEHAFALSSLAMLAGRSFLKLTLVTSDKPGACALKDVIVGQKTDPAKIRDIRTVILSGRALPLGLPMAISDRQCQHNLAVKLKDAGLDESLGFSEEAFLGTFVSLEQARLEKEKDLLDEQAGRKQEAMVNEGRRMNRLFADIDTLANKAGYPAALELISGEDNAAWKRWPEAESGPISRDLEDKRESIVLAWARDERKSKGPGQATDLIDKIYNGKEKGPKVRALWQEMSVEIEDAEHKGIERAEAEARRLSAEKKYEEAGGKIREAKKDFSEHDFSPLMREIAAAARKDIPGWIFPEQREAMIAGVKRYIYAKVMLEQAKRNGEAGKGRKFWRETAASGLELLQLVPDEEIWVFLNRQAHLEAAKLRREQIALNIPMSFEGFKKLALCLNAGQGWDIIKREGKNIVIGNDHQMARDVVLMYAQAFAALYAGRTAEQLFGNAPVEGKVFAFGAGARTTDVPDNCRDLEKMGVFLHRQIDCCLQSKALQSGIDCLTEAYRKFIDAGMPPPVVFRFGRIYPCSILLRSMNAIGATPVLSPVELAGVLRTHRIHYKDRIYMPDGSEGILIVLDAFEDPVMPASSLFLFPISADRPVQSYIDDWENTLVLLEQSEWLGGNKRFYAAGVSYDFTSEAACRLLIDAAYPGLPGLERQEKAREVWHSQDLQVKYAQARQNQPKFTEMKFDAATERLYHFIKLAEYALDSHPHSLATLRLLRMLIRISLSPGFSNFYIRLSKGLIVYHALSAGDGLFANLLQEDAGEDSDKWYYLLEISNESRDIWDNFENRVKEEIKETGSTDKIYSLAGSGDEERKAVDEIAIRIFSFACCEKKIPQLILVCLNDEQRRAKAYFLKNAARVGCVPCLSQADMIRYLVNNPEAHSAVRVEEGDCPVLLIELNKQAGWVLAKQEFKLEENERSQLRVALFDDAGLVTDPARYAVLIEGNKLALDKDAPAGSNQTVLAREIIAGRAVVDIPHIPPKGEGSRICELFLAGMNMKDAHTVFKKSVLPMVAAGRGTVYGPDEALQIFYEL